MSVLSLNAPQASHSFLSFDGGVKAIGILQQPDRYSYWDAKKFQSPRISRGSGLSYTGASFLNGGLSVSHASFCRVIDFDSVKKVVEVEAGIILFSLHSFLSLHGLYLPVQPGHGGITVGGCIAADVHGKNHVRDGTFASQVVSLTLHHPSHGTIELSSEKEPELFRLTCGGYGLTGHIIRARLLATKQPSSTVEIKTVAFTDAISGLTQLSDVARDVDFAYTWHEMVGSSKSFGSGYIFHSQFIQADHSSKIKINHADLPHLSSEWRAALPFKLLNPLSTRAMNVFYRQLQHAHKGKRLPLHQALFPIHQSQIYFKLFGALGFHEYQVILPIEAISEYLNLIKNYVRQHGITVTLGSAKAFDQSQQLLRFTGRGICFALNFPRSEAGLRFMSFLDDQIINLGGIPSIIKDSRLPRKVLDACYPEADEFRSSLFAFDPKRIFRSELSERLGL